MTTPTDTPTDTPTHGREIYADYPALWHLESIGVLDVLRDPDTGAGAGPRSRVAIIDTSVAVGHPNLQPGVNRDLALDFFSNRLGAFPYYENGALFTTTVPNLRTDVNADLPHTSALLDELIDRLSASTAPHINGVGPTTAAEFSNHGTAIAGLVGARPAIRTVAGEYLGHGASDIQFPLPYTGVDPFCEMVPISTNFDTDPEALILAFLYAELLNADVILVPRSIPDPYRTVPELQTVDIDGTSLLDRTLPCEISPRDQALWQELAELIVRVSIKRPVVCAAGNNLESRGIYPANLANEHNGIISVGAVNAKGLVSGYSDAASATILAPSNDSERFDRTSIRLDTQREDFDPDAVSGPTSNHAFSHFDVISTDVPGHHGYSYSPFASTEPAGGMREFGSYFCRFGGTSASSAIIAGFVSLGYSLGDLDRGTDGLTAKNWLLSRAVPITGDDGEFLYPSWNGTVSFPDLYGI